MITVSMFRSNRNINGFEISGHADSGPYGYDLVCAAVSAISFGTVNALVRLCEFEPHVQQGGEGGYLKINLPGGLSDDHHRKAQVLLEGMLVSLETVEQEYSENITILHR